MHATAPGNVAVPTGAALESDAPGAGPAEDGIDELTGAATRRRALDRISADLRAGVPFAVVLLDMDHTRFVNDARGHDVGDAVLVEAASRLRNLVGRDGFVARFGGDEFIVVCQYANRQEVTALAERVRATLASPVQVNGRRIPTSASVGVAFATDEHHRTEDLLRDADVAQYHAKRDGRDRVVVFSVEQRELLARAVRAASKLRRAVANNGLAVALQPIADVPDQRIVGCEALVRWPTDDGRARPAAEFINVAIETGLIREIDLFVLDQAGAALARLRREMEVPPRFMSVNVSLALLSDEDFVDTVVSIVRRHGCSPSDLCLEIPETIFAEERRIFTDNLEAVRTAGCYVALDDFGTGWSSLGALRRLPIDVLKIDKSFVDGLGTDPNDTAIVTSILSLAHAMGLHVVAEGAETWHQIAELVRLGCPIVQGYGLARPVAIDRFASTCAWVADAIPDKGGLARAAAAARDRASWRGQPTLIDECLHQLNVPRRSCS